MNAINMDQESQEVIQPHLWIGAGMLADAAAQIRAQLARDLKNGKPIQVSASGNATGKNGEQPTLQVGKGKLASQWYERDPQRLQDEIAGMRQFFPQFRLLQMADGRYYWTGHLTPGLLADGWSWEIAAIYTENHPNAQMGGSVHVVLLTPSLDQLKDALGWMPGHLLHDSRDGLYLCTNRAEDMSVGEQYESTAVEALGWAVKWLSAMELVLSGELSRNDFNEHDGI